MLRREPQTKLAISDVFSVESIESDHSAASISPQRKSLLHLMGSTALCSLRSFYSMNMVCRFSSLSITIFFCWLTTSSAQTPVATATPSSGGPNTTRLLRFPTTNDRDIVFCYGGQLYTVGKDG